MAGVIRCGAGVVAVATMGAADFCWRGRALDFSDPLACVFFCKEAAGSTDAATLATITCCCSATFAEGRACFFWACTTRFCSLFCGCARVLSRAPLSRFCAEGCFFFFAKGVDVLVISTTFLFDSEFSEDSAGACVAVLGVDLGFSAAACLCRFSRDDDVTVEGVLVLVNLAVGAGDDLDCTEGSASWLARV